MSQQALQNLWNYIQGLELSYDDRHWLADRLYEPVHVEEDLTPYTVEELRASVEEGRRQVEAGEYYTHEEVMRELYEEVGLHYPDSLDAKQLYAEAI